MQKKASLLALYEILREYTDEDHALSRNEIEHLLSLRYQIQIDRKTFRAHLELLNEFGYDIVKNANHEYYLLQHTFEKSEVHLLCNAVHAAHFIPDNSSNQLIDKLLKTQSHYFEQDFHDLIYVKNKQKTVNKEFFLNVEILLEAIKKNKAVRFQYMKYNLQKNLIPRKDHDYLVYPYYIIYANENYYLICRSPQYHDLSHYRIDKMKQIQMTGIDREPLKKSFDPYAYASSKIYMYGGDTKRITLKCDYQILDDIIDKFGSDILLQPCDEKHFFAIIKASTKGMLYYCLQYIRYCEILEPKELREELRETIQSALDQLQKQ